MASSIPIPIAVIGIGCRLPGGVTNTEELWKLLAEGRNTWSAVPKDRFNEAAFYHPDPDNNGTTNHRGGHFIEQDIAAFDATFFGISTVEARSMDPQQRLLLETTFEAFENAGIPVERARGSDTAVYTAMFTRDYDRNIYKDTSDIPKYHTTGCGEAIISNRISYTFDLRGPSMTLDTGCSGSLVSLHQACQSLRAGESSMALASGVNLILNPDHMFGMSNLHMLNDAGRSYPFDSRGSGYGRGEGCTTILLKRLDDALKAGDPIRAVIRNTAINQDGKTNGITLPNGQAQEALERSIYQSAGLDPCKIVYVEAHGTGTVAGDLAELKSIASVFCADGNRKDSLYVGSIKSNIGHLESSSGLAGLIKTILVLEKGLIPPNADFQAPKTNLKLEEWKIKIPTAIQPWPDNRVRQASVNSFGYGGTNAHVILESVSTDLLGDECALKEIEMSEAHQALAPRLYVLSAKSEQSVLEVARRLKSWISARKNFEHYSKDLAHNLSNCRSMMQWRYSCVADSREELMSLLDEKAVRANKTLSNLRIGFIFTGQGAQWVAMGRDLMFTQSQFAESILRSDRILRDLGASWSLRDELMVSSRSSSRINESEIAQPASTALQIALVDLLAGFNIKPQMVLGHSSGEIAAAYTAGAISQETALKISFYRSFISRLCKQKISSKGAMLAVGLGEDEILPFLERTRKGLISIACVNSPSSTTVSGDEAAILEVEEMLNELSVFNRRLKVDTAYHSHHMRKIATEYLDSLGTIVTQPPKPDIEFISSVTAMKKTGNFGSAYWVENLVSKVRFSNALQEYCRTQLADAESMSRSTQLLVEIGPHSALAGPVRQTIGQMPQSFKYIYLPTLVRNRSAINSVLETAGKMFEHGHYIDCDVANLLNCCQTRPSYRVLYDLPSYPWDHSTTFWYESRLSRDYRLRRHPSHDLLGLRIVGSTTLEPHWRHVISIDSLPWLQDHIIDGLVIFPGAAYMCMAIEATRQVAQDSQPVQRILRFVMKDILFLKALVVPPAPSKVELQLRLRVHQSGQKVWSEFCVSAISENEVWYEHCRGMIKVELRSLPGQHTLDNLDQAVIPDAGELFNAIPMKDSQKLNAEALYDQLRRSGNLYGPLFAAITELEISETRALSRIRIPDVLSSMSFNYMQEHVIHPTTLDALMHSSLPLYTQQCGPGSVMPVSIGEVTISADITNTAGLDLYASAALTPKGLRSAEIDLCVFEDNQETKQEPVLIISDLELRGVGEMQAEYRTGPTTRDMSYQIKWGPDIDHLSLETIGSPRCFVTYLEHLCFKYPQRTVLQIGTGLSTATTQAVQVLGDNNVKVLKRYDLTDKSAESLDQARMALRDEVDQACFKLLDIENDPVEQGFVAHAYDLIIAVNLLQASVDLKASFTNAHKLLKHGGRLVLIEDCPSISTALVRESLIGCSFDYTDCGIDSTVLPAQLSTILVSQSFVPQHPSSIRSIQVIAHGDGEEITIGFARELCLLFSANGFETCLSTWNTDLSSHDTLYIVVDDGNNPMLVSPTSDRFQQITRLLCKGSNILWVSAQEEDSAAINPEKALITGLARSARAENDTLRFVTLDVQQAISSCLANLGHKILSILHKCFGSFAEVGYPEETEYIFQGGRLCIPRLLPDAKINTWIAQATGKPSIETVPYGQCERLLKLDVIRPGMVESISFVDEETADGILEDNAVEVTVKAHGTSRNDGMILLGQTKPLVPILGECAGIITAVGPGTDFQVGDRVCVIGGTPYANRVRSSTEYVHRLPDSLSFVAAASALIAYMTACRGLMELAGLQKDQTILIHAIDTDLGYAALAVARHIGAEVLVTISDPKVRESLVRRLNVSASHVVVDDAAHLKKRVLTLTHGKGVDVVFSPPHSHESHRSFSYLAPLGTFVQVGESKGQMDSTSVDKSITFISFDLGSYSHYRPHSVPALLQKAISILETSTVSFEHYTRLISISDISNAFKMIQSQKHTEKIVLEVNDAAPVTVLTTRRAISQLDPKATYLIAGGLGDLGQKICHLLVERGAECIVILSRRTLGQTERETLQDRLRQISARMTIHSMACDISDRSMVERVAADLKEMGLPPVKGVIQSAAVLQDRVLERMSLEDWQVPLRAKVHGTHYLNESFKSSSLDFFVMLSSLSGTVGSRGQANYAAGNTFQDALTNSQPGCPTRYVALNLGMIADTSAYEDNGARMQNLLRQGWIPIRTEEVLALLDYALSAKGRGSPCKQVAIGIDGRSIHEADNTTATIKGAMFNHVREPDLSGVSDEVFDDRKVTVRDAQSLPEAQQIITAAISEQLSSLVALTPDKINVELSISDFGLDSLTAIELKNWIAREFSAAIQASEILDEPSILTLANKIASRSTLIQETLAQGSRQGNFDQAVTGETNLIGMTSKPPRNDAKLDTGTRLPRLPLPELKDTLELYLQSASSFLSEDELERTTCAIAEFQNGSGRNLQKRLADRAQDPQVLDWQYDPLVNGIYLNRRDPVYPYGIFYGSHLSPRASHTQAERAAVISASAYHFKLLMDAGNLEQEFLNEEPLCMDSLQWLFNTTREPGLRVDKIHKYPDNDYLVVLRRGHLFKVVLTDRGESISYKSLKAIFEAILDQSEMSLLPIATLSADRRDSWAEIRTTIGSISDTNRSLIRMIEAAAFTVCLDDGSPNTSTERCNQFLLGDPGNRWSDKSLQFVVCENGSSAYICEHSMLDALSVKQLNCFVTKAIHEHQPEIQIHQISERDRVGNRLEEFSFEINSTIANHITRVQTQFRVTHRPVELTDFSLPTFSRNFFRAHKIPAKAGCQLAIQLASRLYFGEQHPSWESLTMMPFHKGRTEWMQVVSSAVMAFCQAAAEDRLSAAERRTLLHEAATMHSKTMMRIGRGKGFAAHLEALRAVVGRDESLPTLFHDAAWDMMSVLSPRKIKTDASEDLMVEESGFLMPDPESVWVHYEVKDDGCIFWVQSTTGKTQRFREALMEAASRMKVLLEG